MRLRLLTSPDDRLLQRHIVWAHQSEILDSREFSEPGEILLTVGLKLPAEPLNAPGRKRRDYADLCDAYMRGMNEAGVVACGFGTGIKHRTVPEALVRAAWNNQVPLFEIPLEIPFQNIERMVSEALARDEYIEFHRMLIIQRSHITTANSQDPVPALLKASSESFGGWQALLTTAGTVVRTSPHAPQEMCRNIGLEFIERRETTRRGKPPRTIDVTHGTLSCHGCEITDDSGECIGLLISGSHRRDDVSIRLLRTGSDLNADILSAVLGQRRILQKRMNLLRTGLIRHAMLGQVDIVRDICTELWGKYPREPLEVWFLPLPHSSSDGMPSATDTHDSVSRVINLLTTEALVSMPEQSGTVLFGAYGPGLWIVGSELNHESITNTIDKASPDITPDFGVSVPHDWTDLQFGFTEAHTAARLKRLSASRPGPSRRRIRAERGGAESSRERLSVLSQIDLVDQDMADAYSHELLAPLLNTPRSGGRTQRILLATLQALVNCSFNVTKCADQLHVHRHTVENRMARLQELLGVDLSDVADTSKIWFAINALNRRQARQRSTFHMPETPHETRLYDTN
ncbi:PucR family transcriptional regulator [uncultured Bifidobacterium sp.]|uniref:PucR family transcriptional regulator n=1 Tax=uncultured Bifidobacterium sp. TaxID=165187 RepID=UPI0028DC285B|nr:PucR family transcriptional regulator [uncultured Bifidobacterium sp.]